MATYTTNYNLIKPADADGYDIAHQNGNMDIIDSGLNALNSKISKCQAFTLVAETDVRIITQDCYILDKILCINVWFDTQSTKINQNTQLINIPNEAKMPTGRDYRLATVDYAGSPAYFIYNSQNGLRVDNNYALPSADPHGYRISFSMPIV